MKNLVMAENHNQNMSLLQIIGLLAERNELRKLMKDALDERSEAWKAMKTMVKLRNNDAVQIVIDVYEDSESRQTLIDMLIIADAVAEAPESERDEMIIMLKSAIHISQVN